MVKRLEVIQLEEWEEYIGNLLDVKKGFLVFKYHIVVIPTKAHNILEPLKKHVGENIVVLKTDSETRPYRYRVVTED